MQMAQRSSSVVRSPSAGDYAPLSFPFFHGRHRTPSGAAVARRSPATQQRRSTVAVMQAEASTTQQRTVKVAWRVRNRINLGQHVAIVGSDELLGNWDPQHGVELTWTDGDEWVGELAFEPGVNLQYKFVVRSSNGYVCYWKPGGNSSIDLPSTPGASVRVAESWDGKLFNIVEESATSPVPQAAATADVTAFESVHPPQSLVASGDTATSTAVPSAAPTPALGGADTHAEVNAATRGAREAKAVIPASDATDQSDLALEDMDAVFNQASIRAAGSDASGVVAALDTSMALSEVSMTPSDHRPADSNGTSAAVLKGKAGSAVDAVNAALEKLTTASTQDVQSATAYAQTADATPGAAAEAQEVAESRSDNSAAGMVANGEGQDAAEVVAAAPSSDLDEARRRDAAAAAFLAMPELAVSVAGAAASVEQAKAALQGVETALDQAQVALAAADAAMDAAVTVTKDAVFEANAAFGDAAVALNGESAAAVQATAALQQAVLTAAPSSNVDQAATAVQEVHAAIVAPQVEEEPPAQELQPKHVAEAPNAHDAVEAASTVSDEQDVDEVAFKLLKLDSAVSYLPHPDKVSYGGEDAHFISDVGGGAIGVADGVGGWQESGVNPAEYSRTLMAVACQYLEGRLTDLTEEELEDRGRETGPVVDPRGAMNSAHMRTKVPGSATACVMQLDQANGTLVAANLGDSGFVVVRRGKIIARSKALQHYFDCPLQFGSFPEFVEATDTAEMADMYTVQLRPGDIIVAGSDGLWDNVYDSEIIKLTSQNQSVQVAANEIAALTREHASDNEFASPYAREALSQGLDLPWWEKLMGAQFKNGRFQLRQLTGGKQDDITVIVSRVLAAEPPPASQ